MELEFGNRIKGQPPQDNPGQPREATEPSGTALRESEERLRGIADNIPAGMAYQNVTLPDGTVFYTYVSSGIERLFGLTARSVMADASTLRQLIVEEDRPRVTAIEQEALRDSKPLECEFRSRSVSGDIQWVHCRATGKLREDGSTVWTGVITDITAQKRAEAEAQAQQIRLGMTLEAAGMVTWEWDVASGSIRYFDNRSLSNIVRGEAVAPYCSIDSLMQKIHPADRERLARTLDRAIREGKPWECEYRPRMLDGNYRWILGRGRIVVLEGGRPIRMLGVSTDITEHKEVDERLRRSEALYRAIGESIDYGVWVCTPDGRNTYASDSFLKLVGMTQEQCSNFGWGDVLHPEDAERTIAAWKECCRTGGTWDIEHRYRGVDGQYYDILARGVPVKDERGEVVCWAGINLDISRLKRAQAATRASETRFRLLSDTAARLLAMQDPQGAIHQLCREVMEYLDCQVFFNYLVENGPEAGIPDRPNSDGGRVHGRQSQDSIPNVGAPAARHSGAMARHGSEDDGSGRVSSLHLNAYAGIADGEARRIEWLNDGDSVCRCVAQEGRRIVAEDIQRSEDPRTMLVKSYGVQAYCCHPLVSQRRVIGTLSFGTKTRPRFTSEEVELMRTIADQVALGIQRSRTLKAVEAARVEAINEKNRLASVMETLPIGVAILDAQGVIVRTNREFEELWGGPRPPIRSVSDYAAYRAWWADTGKPVRPEEWASARAVLRGETVVNQELQIQRFDGSRAFVLNGAAPIRDASGRITGCAVAIRDITERKQAEEARRHLQRLESIGRLAGGVAHEINNPLTGIMGFAQLIAAGTDKSSALGGYTGEIIRLTERVAIIVRKLLTFARHETPPHSPADFREIVEDALSLIQTVTARDKITVESDIPDCLPALSCRSQQIQQVLINLLTNACDSLNEKYREGHPDKILRVTVQVLEKAGKPWIRATVEDHGMGIPQEIQGNIFDPFFTTKELHQGAGLGLAISHGIVEEHGGQLHLESEFGQWTRFHLDLPLYCG